VGEYIVLGFTFAFVLILWLLTELLKWVLNRENLLSGEKRRKPKHDRVYDPDRYRPEVADNLFDPLDEVTPEEEEEHDVYADDHADDADDDGKSTASLDRDDIRSVSTLTVADSAGIDMSSIADSAGIDISFNEDVDIDLDDDAPLPK
jgi:hypothetical protein